MLSCWYLLLFGLLYYLWYHIYAFSLLFCKVYLKRANSGSWNSGLEKEQILVHYSAQLQMPWKFTWNFLGLYKKYWAKEVPEGGCQGATSPATATPWWRSGGLWAPWRPTSPPLLLYEASRSIKNQKEAFSWFRRRHEAELEQIQSRAPAGRSCRGNFPLGGGNHRHRHHQHSSRRRGGIFINIFISTISSPIPSSSLVINLRLTTPIGTCKVASSVDYCL